VLRCRVNFGDIFQGKRNASYVAGYAVPESGLLKNALEMFSDLKFLPG
jgi:hypothetical protein